VDQFACLEVLVKRDYVVMTLFESLSPSYEYLIIAMETMPMKELTMEYVISRLIDEMTKRKEKNIQGGDLGMVTYHSKGGNLYTRKDISTCYNCEKVDHIASYCYKAKNK